MSVIVFFTISTGKIPLRHLVYRVHALPASMHPLVWDFGQLKPDIEELYIRQIVSRYVCTSIKDVEVTVCGNMTCIRCYGVVPHRFVDHV